MPYPLLPPLNPCSVNNSGQMNIGKQCWNVGAMESALEGSGTYFTVLFKSAWLKTLASR